jgi:hypothetical protein
MLEHKSFARQLIDFLPPWLRFIFIPVSILHFPGRFYFLPLSSLSSALFSRSPSPPHPTSSPPAPVSLLPLVLFTFFTFILLILHHILLVPFPLCAYSFPSFFYLLRGLSTAANVNWAPCSSHSSSSSPSLLPFPFISSFWETKIYYFHPSSISELPWDFFEVPVFNFLTAPLFLSNES